MCSRQQQRLHEKQPAVWEMIVSRDGEPGEDRDGARLRLDSLGQVGLAVGTAT
jgi:hypothetical protein